MKKQRVGVIRDVTSIDSGGYILKYFPVDQYIPVDIFIDTQNVWHILGKPINPHNLAMYVDSAVPLSVRLDITHLLETIGIPFYGSRGINVQLALHHDHRQKRLLQEGIKTLPYSVIYNNGLVDIQIHDVFKKLPLPLSVRKIIDVKAENLVCNTFFELRDAVHTLIDSCESVVVESMYRGHRGQAHIIEGFRNTPLYSLVESQEATYTIDEKKAIERVAQNAYQVLNFRGCATVKYVFTAKDCYVQTVNPFPLFAETSPLQASFNMTGITHAEFVEHVLKASSGK